jgi:hypothetical protein
MTKLTRSVLLNCQRCGGSSVARPRGRCCAAVYSRLFSTLPASLSTVDCLPPMRIHFGIVLAIYIDVILTWNHPAAG